MSSWSRPSGRIHGRRIGNWLGEGSALFLDGPARGVAAAWIPASRTHLTCAQVRLQGRKFRHLLPAGAGAVAELIAHLSKQVLQRISFPHLNETPVVLRHEVVNVVGCTLLIAGSPSL
jgi:hypothetical protein